MHIWKMNGAGNDFIIINNMKGEISREKWPEIAKLLCERHLSVGADGIMAVEKSEKDADFKMLYYNSDGTEGEMCGNGARCICRYGYENGLGGEQQMIETASGMISGWRIDKRQYKIRLNNPSKVRLNLCVQIGGVDYLYSYLELGEPGLPHIAVPIKGLKERSPEELFALGRALRYHRDFPKGVNVNFYECLDDGSIYEITYERGVEDFTYACGTGTASVVTALYLQGLVTGDSVKVDMKGGSLFIDIVGTERSVDELYLTGSTNIVLKGEVFDEEWIG